MTTWVETSIRDVAVINYGRALTWDKRRAGRFPVFGSAGVVGWHDRHLAEGPGLVIGRKGSIGNVFFCKTAFWPIDTVYYINKVAPRCHLPYLNYVLQTLGLDHLNEDTAVPGLNIETVYERRFPLPPLSEQKRLAGALSILDDKMDLVRRQNDTLTAMADTVFRGMLMGEGSRQVPLSHFGDIVCGHTPSTRVKSFHGGEVPFVKIPDMRGNQYVLETKDTLTELGLATLARKTVPPGAVCVSCLGTVGLVSFSARRCLTNQQICSIVPRDSRHRLFLFCLLRSLSDELESLASGSTVTPNLNLSTFSKIKVYLPEGDRLARFNAKVSPLFAKILENLRQKIVLRDLRAMILPRLLDRRLTLARETEAGPVPPDPPSLGLERF
jgi:type I restriction enzyme S subunit